MERPELLWVDMQPTRASDPPREFSRHFHVRLVSRTHLWNTATLISGLSVIVLDFDHPDMDGLQFAASTKAQFPSIPIVMLIRDQSTQIVLWALRARIFDVLIKPVVAHEVLRVTERLAPILAAKRSQSNRANVATMGVLPDEARFRVRNYEDPKLAVAKEFIAKHYSQPIDETEMAQMCGMNAFRFSRSFRKAFGSTFRDYLALCRVRHAQRLLRNPEIAITDVASMVGFSDPSYFARLFRKRVGLSPSSFRNSQSTQSVDLERSMSNA